MVIYGTHYLPPLALIDRPLQCFLNNSPLVGSIYSTRETDLYHISRGTRSGVFLTDSLDLTYFSKEI